MTPSAVERRLQVLLESGVRVLFLQTTEEKRVIDIFEGLGTTLGWPTHTWSSASGINRSGNVEPLDPLLSRLLRTREPELWILFDGADEVRTTTTKRTLRELAQRSHGPAIVIVGPDPGRLREISEVVFETLPLPTRSEILDHLQWMASVLERSGHRGARRLFAPEDVGLRLADVLAGLDLPGIDQVLAEGVATHGFDRDTLVGFVARAKARRLARLDLLDPVEPASIEEVGGLDQLKLWLKRRRVALDPASRQAAIWPPRGVLLVGVQGCGKSLAARACADTLGLPLFRLEPGRLFGGTVGESEANLRRMTALAERLAPLVLWIDEIDKGLAGTEGSASDAGTSARVLGALLTWLQDRRGTVFVVATANRIDQLPPELLRRGRLDEIFFLDLPEAGDREQILRVHLEVLPLRVLGDVPPLGSPFSDFARVAHEAEGFSGAEIASALTEARIEAYSAGRPVSASDFRTALEATVPLSQSRAEAVEGLRHWARDRARRA